MAARGAMPCFGLLALADIEAEWQRAGLRIATGWGEGGANLHPSLYLRVLGSSYFRQSPAGQILHDAGSSQWKGRCTVTGAQTVPGRLLSWLLQLPQAAADAPIVVAFSVAEGREAWTR